ncbi:MAG TPA: hypothetical protein VGD50_00270 [Candidatus Baltobacteraceae bacterium]
MTGAVMIGVFALFAGLMYARVLPALLAVPFMAVALALVAGAGATDLASVLVDGSVKLAAVFAYVIFGALLSRVTMSTGIAETIISYAAEFGGDQPVVLALALAAAVAVLFTSLYGLGAIIMVGSIVLPIMMTIGIPRRTAATLFLLAYALGFIFNISQWGFYTKTFGVSALAMRPYALTLAAIDFVVLVIFVAVRFRSTRGSAAWALPLEEEPAKRRVHAIALLTPVLPIIGYFALGMNPIVAFILAALFGVLVTKPRQAIPTLVSSAIRGVEDVAPALLLFVGIGMLLAATGLPEVKLALAPVVAAVAPRNPLSYVILFGLLSPLALYRGPLNPFGVGIGVYTVLAGLGILPPVALVAAVMAVVQVQNVCDPTNTQNVWVANFTGVHVDEITRLTLPYQVAVATFATISVVVFGTRLFGTAPIAMDAAVAATITVVTPTSAPALMPRFLPTSTPTPALMPTLTPVLALPGLYAPPAAAHTIAITSTDAKLSWFAAHAVERQIAGGWSDQHAIPLDGDPTASDCKTKAYAAVLRLSSTLYHWAYEPDQIDVGLELLDCAGWPVDQWHQQASFPREEPAREATLERLGLDALLRFRTWMYEKPLLAQSLLVRGLAYDPAQGPTYLYTLFKTNDGQMRLFVRPGGPAYVAGLRTNDIVSKLDGKFWWEYGTFQTQSRAYDGLPHTFEVNRGSRTLDFALGSPFQ